MVTLLLLAALTANADEAPASPRSSWSARHPVALGARLSAWGAGYVSAGVGGHIRLRPWRRLGLELFADHNTHALNDGAWLFDDVIGFHLFAPLGPSTRWYVGPTLGSCVDFQTVLTRGPDASAVRFAPHAGLQAEVQLGKGLALELGATFFLYVGNRVDVDGWTVSRTSGLLLSPTGQGTLALNLTL